MIIVYQISIYLYYLAILIASIFNPKAKLWINGRKNIFKLLKNKFSENDNIYWFHCASLGEFEQGKPIIDKLKSTTENCKIVITFFSPSGYELRKNYKNADLVCYLPIDTPKNAKQFIDLTQPKQVFFIKYEFWYNYLAELHRQKIATFLIAGVFRKEQIFFKWYGTLHKKMLSYFTHFFVQNENSRKLLKNLNLNNVSLSGDTRLDRVYSNSLTPLPLPLIKLFKANKKIIVLGSSWQKEEEIIAEYIKSCKKDYKFIIAPHNINKNHIQNIKKLLSDNFICYAEAKKENIAFYKILIIDNIGILANIYQYTDIAFIGGGFTGSLHNILEPASFANVVLFGKKHSKFHEADELIKLNAAFNIADTDDLIAIINHLEVDDNLDKAKMNAKNYIKNGIGASKIIFNILQAEKTSF